MRSGDRYFDRQHGKWGTVLYTVPSRPGMARVRLDGSPKTERWVPLANLPETAH